MGTNYYAETEPPCKCCGSEYEKLHIGKSSVGWCFSLATHDEPEIRSMDDWRAYLSGKRIVDEYGDYLTLGELLVRIVGRGCDRPLTDDDIAAMSGPWCKAERGPNNLLRHSLDSRCIAHGDGTWDVFAPGEFS